MLASAEKLLRALYTSSAAAPAPAEEEAESAPAGDTTFPADLAALFKAPSSAGAVAAAALLSDIEPRLQVSRNDVDGPSRHTKAQSGPALLVSMTDTDEDNSLVCSENRFYGRGADFGGVVELIDLVACTVDREPHCQRRQRQRLQPPDRPHRARPDTGGRDRECLRGADESPAAPAPPAVRHMWTRRTQKA